MKPYNIELQLWTAGWVCMVSFSVTTVNQFTDERHEAAGAASRFWVVALVRGLLAARRSAGQLAAKPGQRAAKGWPA